MVESMRESVDKSAKEYEACGKGAEYEPKQIDKDNGGVFCSDAVLYDLVPCSGSGGNCGGARAEAGEPDNPAHCRGSREGCAEPGSGDRDGAG